MGVKQTYEMAGEICKLLGLDGKTVTEMHLHILPREPIQIEVKIDLWDKDERVCKSLTRIFQSGQWIEEDQESEAHKKGRARGEQERGKFLPEPYPPYEIGTSEANNWITGYREGRNPS